MSATPSGNSVTVAVNDPTVVADGTIHLPVNSLGMNVTLGSTTPQVAKIVDTNLVTSASGSVVTSADANPTISTNLASFTVNNTTQEIRIHEAIQSNIANTSIGPSDQTFAITVVNPGSGNVFYVDGVAKPALALVKGKTYTFDQSDNSNSGHPLVFVTAGGSSYTSGVTVTGTAGQAGAKVTFVVPQDAPPGLAYVCSVHGAGMGAVVSISAVTNILLEPTIASNSLSISLGSVDKILTKLVTGNVVTSAVGTITLDVSVTKIPETNLATASVNPLSIFTWGEVDDTTTGGSSWTEVDSTTGAGGSSWQEVA